MTCPTSGTAFSTLKKRKKKKRWIEKNKTMKRKVSNTNTRRLVRTFPARPRNLISVPKPTPRQYVSTTKKDSFCSVHSQNSTSGVFFSSPADRRTGVDGPSVQAGENNKTLLPHPMSGGEMNVILPPNPIQSVKSTHLKLTASQVRSWVCLKHTTQMKGKQIQNQT